MKLFTQQKNNQKGFVMLFAVLISAVVLAITLGISNVAYKEVVLTSQAREANYAFFAADSGAECALYGDLQKTGFGTPDGTTGVTSFDCNGKTLTPSSTLTGGLGFQLEFTNADTNTLSCANIDVHKDAQVTLPDGTTASYTEIRSLGYNASCTEAGNGGSRLVERAIKVQYPNDVVAPPVTP